MKQNSWLAYFTQHGRGGDFDDEGVLAEEDWERFLTEPVGSTTHAWKFEYRENLLDVRLADHAVDVVPELCRKTEEALIAV